MNRKRHAFLLLELTISLVIMGIVMGMLFLGYQQTLMAKQKIHEEKEKVLHKQRLLLRLRQIFRSVESFKEVPKQGFFLTYDASMDPDPDFRGMLEGVLFLDRNRLVLMSWSNEGKSRVEVLYENVGSASYLFFDSKTGSFEEKFPETSPLMVKVELDKWEIPLFL